MFRNQDRLENSLSAVRSQWIVATLLTAVWATTSSSAHAQFIFTGPHEVEPGPIVFVGDAAEPIDVALETWIKNIGDSDNTIPATATMDFVETIHNSGSVAWASWYEELLEPPGGLDPSLWFWNSVISVTVNGDPLAFTTSGLGTFELTIDFAAPVFPGDILVIHKQVDVDGVVDADGGPLIRMLQRPTPVPEPGSLALAAVSSLLLLAKRRGR